jgi:hypothetical protein
MRIKNKTGKFGKWGKSKKYKGGSHWWENKEAEFKEPIKLITLNKIIVIFNKINGLNSSSDEAYKIDIIKNLMESDIKKLIKEIIEILEALDERKNAKNITKKLKDISIQIEQLAPKSNKKKFNDFDKINKLLPFFKEIQDINDVSNRNVIDILLRDSEIKDIIQDVTDTLNQILQKMQNSTITPKQIRRISTYIQSVAFEPLPKLNGTPIPNKKVQYTNKTIARLKNRQNAENARTQKMRNRLGKVASDIGIGIGSGIRSGIEVGTKLGTQVGTRINKVGQRIGNLFKRSRDRPNDNGAANDVDIAHDKGVSQPLVGQISVTPASLLKSRLNKKTGNNASRETRVSGNSRSSRLSIDLLPGRRPAPLDPLDPLPTSLDPTPPTPKHPGRRPDAPLPTPPPTPLPTPIATRRAANNARRATSKPVGTSLNENVKATKSGKVTKLSLKDLEDRLAVVIEQKRKQTEKANKIKDEDDPQLKPIRGTIINLNRDIDNLKHSIKYYTNATENQSYYP